MSSEQMPEDLLLRFVESFVAPTAPLYLAMSGGEAMLRPRLVRDLADRARDAGTRSMALSGLFFAGSGRIPKLIRRAIGALDHFSVSIDAFHELEVPRAGVINVLQTLLADGVDVSVHICGRDAEDPYLEDITAQLRDELSDAVPMFVNSLAPFGRAKDWMAREGARGRARIDANPCASAAWPLVAFDGSVVACGNDDVTAGQIPAHLLLGHLSRDSWDDIRARCVSSPMLRGIRLFGPEYLASRFGDGATSCDGYCATCMTLSAGPGRAPEVSAVMARESTRSMERTVADWQQAAGAVSFAQRHGIPRYAELVTCGLAA